MPVPVGVPEDPVLVVLATMGWDRMVHELLAPTATACQTAAQRWVVTCTEGQPTRWIQALLAVIL